MAAAVPLLLLAIPVAPEPLDPAVGPWGGPSAGRRDPAVALELLWTVFAAIHPPERATLQDFDVWIEEARRHPVRLGDVARGRWRVDGGGRQRTLSLRGTGFQGEAALVIEERSWAGADHALVASDLSCVLCHGEVRGDGAPAAVLAARRHRSRPDEDVVIDGELVLDAGAVLPGDPLVDLDALRAGRGRLESAAGWRASPRRGGPPTLQPAELEPLTLEDEVLGPVVLVGTETDPIGLEGNVVVDGDLLLDGSIHGGGTIFVDGNLFIPSRLTREGEGPVPLIVVSGHVLAGDVLRPRQGMTLPVTGDASGSFGFLCEALARFNGRDGAAFSLLDGQPAVALPRGGTTGDWFDPRLTEVDGAAERVGPASCPDGGPWLALELLRRTPEGELLSVRREGLAIDATLVVTGAFVAVAPGLEVSGRDAPDEDSINGEVPLAPPGSVRIHGSLAARHAAVHAPAGLRILDRAVDRGRLSSLHSGGLRAHVVRGPEGQRIPAGPIAAPTPPDRLGSPAGSGPSPNR